MPSTNHFKFGASELLSATRGGFAVGVKSGTDYGPTSLTGFWNGITPPVGGYTIYVDKASQGPSIHVAYDNTECIKMLLHMGATGSTIENVLAWANGQSNMAVLSDELTVGDLPGGSTPTPTPQPTSTPTPTPVTYTIGQAALGGVIAYIDGGFSTGTSGLVATTANISTGATWGCQGTLIGTSRELGTGNQNTIDIMAGCATAGIPARLCGDLVEGGFSDWYLPSIDELYALYPNRVAIGGFASASYWSSSESDDYFAWTQNFSDGTQYDYNKTNSFYVRAIRSF